MRVPYAKKWQKEADKLRKIVLDCDLIEEMKCLNVVHINLAYLPGTILTHQFE